MLHKKSICIALLFCLCMTFCACGTATETEPPTTQTETNVPEITLEEYKELISVACNSLYENAIVINNVITFEDSYWKIISNVSGSNPDENNLVEHGMDILEKKSDNKYSRQWLEDAFENDSTKYKEIIATDVPEGAEKIYETYETYFDAYLGLYNLAFAPGGSRSAFDSKANEYINTITNANTKIELLLSD